MVAVGRSNRHWRSNEIAGTKAALYRLPLWLGKRTVCRMSLRRRLVVVLALVAASLGVTSRAEAVSWSTYMSSSQFMYVYTQWAQSPYVSLRGVGMTSCSSGWTVGEVAINSGGHQLHSWSFDSSLCSGSYYITMNHTDPSTKAMCTNFTGGNETANCRRGIP